ncbi:NAD(P)-dependent oxidoreductase, partial [Streptomyces sp. SID4940]|nr:NAD(P)-dependent oxidoreductase [Streptomyces sp. SID4940]
GRVEEAAHDGRLRPVRGVSWQCSDSAAAGAALGWRPSYSLDDSAAALWAARAGAGTARPKPLPAPSEGVRAP